MTVDVVVQAVAWIAATWLLVDQVRLRPGQEADAGHRAAPVVAAGVVVVLAATAGLWPVAAIGLLWLRTSAFPHTAVHLPTTHLPHLKPRQQRLIFRVELVLVAIVIALMLSDWVAEELDLFDRRADDTLCRMLDDRC